MSRVRRLAAVDIGTVTTRLLVADVDESNIAEVVRSTDITHLGEGLTATGVLSAPAMQRVADVVARYASLIAENDVEHVTALATSASRDAENGADFLDLLEHAGMRPEIIEGGREADLAFLGATFGLTGEDLLVADLGGGSTELVLGSVGFEGGHRHETISSARSIDVGSKRVTELFLHSDPPTAAELAAAREWSAQQMRPYFDGLRTRPRKLFALAGTATSLAAIHERMERYDPERVHGLHLGGADLAEMIAMLAAMSLEQRKQVVGLDPGRAPVIVAGALVLETVLGLAGLGEAVISEHDILHGILVDTWRDLENGTSGIE